MITVRIHLNPEEGTTWWAEGGDFVGGSGRLNQLLKKVKEWTITESQEVAFELVEEEPVHSSADPPPLREAVSAPPASMGDHTQSRFVSRMLPVGV